MKNKIAINPELLTWARERARLDELALTKTFPKLQQWELGEEQPTMKQLEKFAAKVHVPIGYLFLPQPIEESLPIPDFRTVADRSISSPSPDLLDTIYLCQQRQDWYQNHARMNAQAPLNFIGSVNTQHSDVEVANKIHTALDMSTSERQQSSNWEAALRYLISKAEAAGILVMISGVVGNNPHRKLDVEEFRGFALADPLAPLIFINGADSKSAQMFTLAHELAHLWLGESGVSDAETGRISHDNNEKWCNTVAAELLIPMAQTQQAYQHDEPIPEQIQRLAKQFKVSTLVALRRLYDAGFITQALLWQHYREEVTRIQSLTQNNAGGGDFYRTLGARTGKRFAKAVITSTLEGSTLFQDAYRLLGVKKNASFYKAARSLEVIS